MTEDDRSKFNAAINDISDSKLYLYDIKNNSIHNLISAIRKHKILFNIEVAVVDYLQLVSGDKGKNREQEIGEISRMLKNIAKELNITVIALSQLNRDKDHYPTMNRLRDSGQILESADNVVFIYRQDMWIGEGYSETYKDGTPADGVAKIIFAKGRNIGVTDFYMDFDPKITKFKNRNTYLPTQNEF